MDIADIHRRIVKTNVDNGWREGREQKLEHAPAETLLADLMLIDTEVSEAAEDIRNGAAPNEVWYTGGYRLDGGRLGTDAHDRPYDMTGAIRKAEGPVSELADILVRTLDTVDKWGIPLDLFLLVLEHKLEYNASRGKRHGGKTA